jgi:hypothetical protein
VSKITQLTGAERKAAEAVIRANHYTHTVPSGKSYYFQFDSALVVWSIPANKNIARFLLKKSGECWELSRLWAPDGHPRNLLTQAISQAVKALCQIEKPDILVSYADPNAGHTGGVYKAASWRYHGKSEEVRVYQDATGQRVARRAFHSGKNSLTKSQIEARGFVQLRLPGKERFIKPISRWAKKLFA